jgi:peptidoglycan/LPS O-acetylase OafA/YrhL
VEARRTQSQRVRGLDGVRALAALAVFAEHQLWPFHRIRSGDLGVEIFFVLSGYLIIGMLTARSQRAEAESNGKAFEIGRFFVHRSFRIFPPYLALIAIITLIDAALRLDYVNYGLYPAYLTYTTNLVFGYVSQGWPHGQNFGHFWTLAVEEQFYLVMAPIFICLAPRRHLLACLGVLGAGALAATALILLHMPWFTLRMDSLVNFGFLALGGIISQTTRVSPGRRDQGFAAAGLLLGLAFAFCLVTGAKDGAGFVLDLGYGVISMLIVWLIVKNQASRIVGFLETWPLRRIGRISYALYLVHMFIRLPPTGLAFKGMDLIVVVNLAVSLALAQLSWWLIEGPCLKFRDRIVMPWLSKSPLPVMTAARRAGMGRTAPSGPEAARPRPQA